MSDPHRVTCPTCRAGPGTECYRPTKARDVEVRRAALERAAVKWDDEARVARRRGAADRLSIARRRARELRGLAVALFVEPHARRVEAARR